MNSSDLLAQPISVLSGAGTKTLANFAKLGIHTLWDLLLHLPLRYENRTTVIPIAEALPGDTVPISGTVELIDVAGGRRKNLICRLKDDTGFLHLRFFHYSARQFQNLKPGTELLCYGEVRLGFYGLEMIHPDYRIIREGETLTNDSTLTPVYPSTQSLTQNVIRKLITQTLTKVNKSGGFINELIPLEIRNNLQLPSLTDAINMLHAPDHEIDMEKLTGNHSPFRRRLALEELLAHHLSVKAVKSEAQSRQAAVIHADPDLAARFIDSLPFRLTDAQAKVMTEIAADFQHPHPMLRLVQGDVGSGKTVVAAYAALLAAASGFQVAIMAPTELLAEQHFRNFSQWLSNYACSVILLTSQLTQQKRRATLAAIADGTINIIIGTHALFQAGVNFKALALVIIDEQHRFGVHQRLALSAKAEPGLPPHQLVMTATPIPRTLAMLQYADLDVSIIDQLPPGRKPVTTSVIPNERRDEVIQRIAAWVKQNKQVYWVCTLIDESEILQYQAAENTAKRLAEMLPPVNVGLLHGRMKPADKDTTMQAFKNGGIELLVATTVIEVGVDVPNANLMIIENPERLGLAQLHQLRGRIGRGDAESYCILLYQSPLSENARQRLGIMRDSQDGFYIAEKDLQLRGPGEVMGTRQTGQINFKVADLVKDADILDNIPAIADSILMHAPENSAEIIKRWLGRGIHYFEV